MRTQQLKLSACAVAVLAVCSLSFGHVTKDQEDANLGMEAHVGKLTGHAKDAAVNYRRYCAGCHGDLGDGEGENAVWLDPKPRNFTLATFKCRSTPSGNLPTDQDVYNTVARGFVTTNMPPWIALTPQNRIDMVAYIKTFSPRWRTARAGTPITIPSEPAPTAQGILHGRELL